MYYAVKYSDLFIGYDSGIRNIALTVPNSKIISLENERSLLNRTKIEMLSKDINHIPVDIKKEDSLDIYLKGMSLINDKEIVLSEYHDIIEHQFSRRRR